MFENITISIKDILQPYSFPDVIPHDEPWKSLSVDQIIENGKDKFFDFTFPWYAEDNTGLDDFKNLFLRKYYMRQIGQETTAQFKLYVQARLMEKMPLYKQLYESTLIEYDPLVNRKITTTKDETENKDKGKESENTVTISGNGETTENNTTGREATGEGTQERTNEQNGSQERTNEQEGTLNSEINNQSIHSDNPEITMANKDYASSMDREKKTEEQSTNQSVTENTTNNQSVSENTTNNQSISENTIENNQSNSKANSTEQGNSSETEKEERNLQGNEMIEGFYGESQADAILKYRETILNLNEMICNDMNDLFLGYYGGNDYGLCW